MQDASSLLDVHSVLFNTLLLEQLDRVDLKVSVPEIIRVVCDPSIAGWLACRSGTASLVPVLAASPSTAESGVDDLHSN